MHRAPLYLGCPSKKKTKLERKLVSALSETKRLFLLFRFNTERESFDVSIERKQRDDQPKQFDREHIWYFSENLGLFWFLFVSKQFCLILLFQYRFRNTETNRIFLFLVS
jgi:hypothetical protein